LDEVFVRIRGKLHYLWRAVDQHGNVLDVLVQSRRNTKAAKRFFRKLLPTAPPNARSCRASNTVRAGISTTAVKSRTNRPDGENAT
jgi:transposase-like protein